MNTAEMWAILLLVRSEIKMVVMSIEAYSKHTESVEDALDVADKVAEKTTGRYTHEEMFAKLREAVKD